MKSISLLITISLCLSISSALGIQAGIDEQFLWPKPKLYNGDIQSKPLLTSPCGIEFKVQATPPQPYIRQMIDFYLTQVFHCTKIPSNNITVTVIVSNSTVMTATQTTHDAYQINLKQNRAWSIKANFYSGFIRGLETFSQLFQPNLEEALQKRYSVRNIPVQIKDEPLFKWRGLMIDTSRHYLPLADIKRTINALMFNKMNILHWHIVDQQSFPMEVPKRPQLSIDGQVNGVYSTSDIKVLINYAKIRGVRIIPEIDTPAHSQSWGRSQSLSKIILTCRQSFIGQFDPTLDLTYEVVKDVMAHINQTFTDNYVHFGGDQVSPKCWDSRPQIQEWMTANKIDNYTELEKYYRKRQKQNWRSISAKKSVIYWADQAKNLPVQSDDVIQWWGTSKNIDKLNGLKNEVIVSFYDQAYLDIGFGNYFGGIYGTYQTWKQIYAFNPSVKGINVIGGQSCIWSELNSVGTHDRKVWMRSSIIAERLWNNLISMEKQKINILKRLSAQSIRMQKRGIKVSSFTNGLCEKNPDLCFK